MGALREATARARATTPTPEEAGKAEAADKRTQRRMPLGAGYCPRRLRAAVPRVNEGRSAPRVCCRGGVLMGSSRQYCVAH